MKTLLATIITALLLTTTAQAGQEYNCKRIDFDTQECEYTGTTTIEDVQDYFYEAKEVIDHLVDTYNFKRISYSTKPGKIVIYTTGDSQDFEVADILSAFHDKNLRLINIVWTYPDLELTAGNRLETEDEPTKGTLRYEALKENNHTVPYDLILSVK